MKTKWNNKKNRAKNEKTNKIMKTKWNNKKNRAKNEKMKKIKAKTKKNTIYNRKYTRENKDYTIEKKDCVNLCVDNTFFENLKFLSWIRLILWKKF